MVEVKVKNPPVLKLQDLLQVAKKYNPNVDLDLVKKAYLFAEEAHKGQVRSTGEPVIQHPLNVAKTIAELRLGTTAIVTALLHDVKEDTSPTYYQQIEPRFGEAVNFLVESVTKLAKVKKLRGNTGSIEDLRTIFLAMTRDIRVVLIKLADRLHNLKTLYGLPTAKQRRIAKQSLDIYAPIADRLGIGNIKGQLEDLSFKYLMPEQSAKVQSLVKRAYQERVKHCDQLRLVVKDELEKNNIAVKDVHGRAKRLYSLHLKLQRYNQDISQIHDLVALRVIVPTIEECYQALGVIHRRWKPLVGKIKDYVATPKANGYRSLHTTVILSKGTFVEIQIRTPEMHEQAEFGVAAKWFYQEIKRKEEPNKISAAIASEQEIAWVKQLASWQEDIDNPEEFFATLRTDFFRNRIFCLTPAGEIINLPEGATPVDFAYCVHTELGHGITGARINGKSRPLDTALTNGDLIQIIATRDESAPKREWLDFVKTNVAKKNIKSWYSRLDTAEAINIGKQLLQKELKQLLDRDIKSIEQAKLDKFLKSQGHKNLDELFRAVGRGDNNPRQVVKRLFTDELLGRRQWLPKRNPLNARVEGYAQNSIKRAACCRPIEGDKILAIRKNDKAIVHRDECRQIVNATESLPAQWIVEKNRSYRVWVCADLDTYVGMLRDLSNACAKENIAIHDVSVKKRSKKMSQISLLIELQNTDQLSDLMRKLRSLSKVLNVVRKKA